jgi:hypothetical protein
MTKTEATTQSEPHPSDGRLPTCRFIAGRDDQEHVDDGAAADPVHRPYHAAVINLTDQGYRAHPLAGSAKQAIVSSAGL